MIFNIDIAIVAAFLILTLFVGLGHGQKVRNIKDYALGGQDFSVAALVATIVATWASGSGFFITMTKVYSDGLYYLLASLCMTIQLLITAFILVPRMGEFLGDISVADSMGKLYGEKVRVITAIAGTIGSMGLIAVQFKAFGGIIGYFSLIPQSFAIIIAGLVVTLYSSMGGIKAVTVTDILQIFTFCFAVPLLGVSVWNSLYGTDFSILTAFDDAKFSLSKVLDTSNPSFWQMIPLVMYFTMPTTLPATFQRISMAKNTDQIKKACIYAAIIFTAFELAMSWIPFLVFNANPNLESGQILGFIINNYTYTGLKGVLIIGVIAMAMSTADSNMNISSVLFSHDVCRGLNIKVKNELMLAKLFSLLLGMGGISLALFGGDLLSIVLTANSFYMPVVTVPLLFTILGFRSSKNSVLAGMAAGFVTIIAWKAFGITTDPIMFAMLMNAIFLIGTHYACKQEGGWVKTLPEDKEKKSANILERLENFTNSVVSCVCKSPSSNNELTYTAFGIYCIIYAVSTMYTTQKELLGPNRELILFFYQVMMVTGTIMAMYPLWPQTISKTVKKRIIKVCWVFSLFYMLTFFSGFFLMVSEFSHLQLVVFSTNAILLIILAGWKLATVMSALGFYCSFEMFKFYRGVETIDFSIGSPQFVFMYSLVLIGSVLVLFLKPKQEQYEDKEAKVDILTAEMGNIDIELIELKKQEGEYTKQISRLNQMITHYSERVTDQAKEIERLGATAQKILNNVNHELRLPVGNVMNFSQMICEGLDKYTPDQLKDLSDEVYKNSTRLSSMILNMLDLATLDVTKVNLNKSTENFSELVRDRVKICRNVYLQGKPLKFKLTIEPEILIPIDLNYIRQVVDNLTINAINFSEKGMIEVEVRRQGDKAVMMMRDEGIGIPRHELFDIFDPFRMGSNTATKAEGRGVGLALCKSAVEAHDGIITAESPEGKGAVFYVVLPREGSIN